MTYAPFTATAYFRQDNQPGLDACTRATASATTSGRPNMVFGMNQLLVGYRDKDIKVLYAGLKGLSDVKKINWSEMPEEMTKKYTEILEHKGDIRKYYKQKRNRTKTEISIQLILYIFFL